MTLHIPQGTTVDVHDLHALERVARAATTNTDTAHRMARLGRHRSLHRYRGLEYTESREYLPGDDVRRMDWPVTARLGKPHTKLFHEDSNRTVWLIVDLGGSMHFGTRNAFKSVHAAHAAAFFGWSAIIRGDSVNATLLGDTRSAQLSALRGRRAALNLMHSLAEFANHRPREMRPCLAARGTAVAQLRRVASHGNVVLISDFARFSVTESRTVGLLNRRSTVTLVRVTDPLEATPLPAGRYLVSDGAAVRALVAHDTRQQRIAADTHARTTARLQELVRHGTQLIEVTTDRSPLTGILSGSGD